MNLEYEILKNEYMGTSAKALLRIIQNNNTPILDLLVREVIQNSIDASLENVSNVEVSINTGKFDTYSLNKHFGEFGTHLYNTYKKEIDSEEITSFVSFSDKNTTGLTGPINKLDAKKKQFKDSKFMNLVFNVGKAQSINGSGGSWGYGKTIYYRAGIGLVIFYTRIKEDDEYKSRLIVTFVEDEEKNNIIKNIDTECENTGIVWFGKKVADCIEPLTDEEEIAQIMTTFKLPLYDGEETGTTIIIPYINKNDLLSKTYYNNEVSKNDKPYWCDNIENYLKVSVQRWYAPRLMNPQYKNGPYLKLFVNRKSFSMNDFLFTFRVIQQLYNYPKKNDIFDDNLKIYEEKIKLKDTFLYDNYVGSIYYTKIENTEFNKEIEEIYKEISNNKEHINGVNPAVITFCRKPGMLLKYDIGEGWSNKIDTTEEYSIIGLFVSNSSTEALIKNGGYPLEEYLRESEKADHSNWQDLPNYNIVKRIQANIQNKVNATYVVKTEQTTVYGGSVLGKKLTKLLLPTIGFGNGANARKKRETTHKKQENIHAPKGRSIIKFDTKSIRRDEINKFMTEDFSIIVEKNDRNLRYEVCIATEEGNITFAEWNEQLSISKIPIEIHKIEILNFQLNNDIIYPMRFSLNDINSDVEDKNLKLKKYIIENVWNGWEINVLNEKIERIHCRLTYKYINNKYLCSVVKQKES